MCREYPVGDYFNRECGFIVGEGPRFFITGANITAGGEYSLAGDDQKHAARVLRLKPGDPVEISDGRGLCFRGNISALNRNEVRVRLSDPLPGTNESPLSITLVQGLLKGAKMDSVIHGAVELGVTRIIPMLSHRSVPVLKKDDPEPGGKLKRWQKIARSAAALSRRSVVPPVDNPLTLKELVMPDIIPRNSLKVFFWEERKTAIIPFLTEQILSGYNSEHTYEHNSEQNSEHSAEGYKKEAVIVIGPEGGLTPAEADMLIAEGFSVAGLGPRILKAETASLAAVAIIQLLWGDIGNKYVH